MTKKCPYCEYDRNSYIMIDWEVQVKIKDGHFLQCDYGQKKDNRLKVSIKYCPMCGKELSDIF